MEATFFPFSMLSMTNQNFQTKYHLNRIIFVEISKKCAKNENIAKNLGTHFFQVVSNEQKLQFSEGYEKFAILALTA